MIIDIPEYTPQRGLPVPWEPYYVIQAKIDGDRVIIAANQPGLVSLARQMLTLAQTSVPAGSHIHHDTFGMLEEGSNALVIEKLQDGQMDMRGNMGASTYINSSLGIGSETKNR